LFAASGNAPWIYAMRVEHTSRAPMLRAPSTTGFVFRDINGNLARDENEPGISGVVLTRTGETAVTDGSGKYRIAGDLRVPVTLDEASLPLGWIRQSAASPDIPVGLSISAQVHFIIAQRSSLDTADVDLAVIRVSARDGKGKEWAARMSDRLVATFDALPPGTYTLELDLSSLREPLKPRKELPVFNVTATDAVALDVTLDTRALMIWHADGAPRQQ